MLTEVVMQTDERELLLHQAAACLAFLQTNHFDKVAKKLRKALTTEYGQVPATPNGTWKWEASATPTKKVLKQNGGIRLKPTPKSSASAPTKSPSDSVKSRVALCKTSSLELPSSQCSDSTSSKQEDSQSTGSKGELKDDSESTANETDDEKQEESSRGTSFSKKKVDSTMNNKKDRVAQRVSFSDEDQVHELPPQPHSCKPQLYYTKMELNRFKIERNQDNLTEMIAQTSATLGLRMSPF